MICFTFSSTAAMRSPCGFELNGSQTLYLATMRTSVSPVQPGEDARPHVKSAPTSPLWRAYRCSRSHPERNGSSPHLRPEFPDRMLLRAPSPVQPGPVSLRLNRPRMKRWASLQLHRLPVVRLQSALLFQ